MSNDQELDSSPANNGVSTNTTGQASGQKSRQQPGSACEECRRRKLRCDRGTPQCKACINSGVQCVMRTSCPPRGPKKGYIRQLQQQIEHLQTRVKAQGQEEGTANNSSTGGASQNLSNAETEDASSEGANDAEMDAPISLLTGNIEPHFGDVHSWSAPVTGDSASLDMALTFPSLDLDNPSNHSAVSAADLHAVQSLTTSHSMLGFDTYLSPMICADLDQLYFDRVHVFAPILHKFRYLSWARRPDKSKQRTCLQYAMWTLAASLSSQFQLFRADLYAEARQRLDALEMDHEDTQTFCIEHVQAWTLLAIYELTSNAYKYKRGMVSAGRAFRLVQLMKLNAIDGPGHAAKSWASQCGGQGDWIDIESMRRTFWVVYIIDRFTSALDGLPLTFSEQQILTYLPAPDDKFMSGHFTSMKFLSAVTRAIDGEQPLDLDDSLDMSSPFTQSIIVATLCGRTLEHKLQLGLIQLSGNEPGAADSMSDFCRRHQPLIAMLTGYNDKLSARLFSTSEHPDPMLIFVALAAHMAIFMLCEGMDTEPPQLCGVVLDAVRQVTMLSTTLGQLNYFQMHPFMPIPLLVSARYCESHRQRHPQSEACNFMRNGIVAALERLAHINGLAENFSYSSSRQNSLG